MTRLERSALDYAIACLARGRRPESLEQLRDYVDGDAYSRAVQEVATALRDDLLASIPATRDREYPRELRGDRWGQSLAYARRIVRAWLALYLRRVRREAACSRWLMADDGDAAWSTDAWAASYMPRAAWRPLYLDAPEYDPLVSPRQRRERGRVAA